MVVEESHLITAFAMILFLALVVLLGYAYLFNNEFFYSVVGDRAFWSSACSFLFLSRLALTPSVFLISAGILYDALRGAPLLSFSPNGVSLFARRGATIAEGLVYGVLGGTLVAEMRHSVLDRQDGEGADGGAEGNGGREANGWGELPVLCAGALFLRHDSPLRLQDALVRACFLPSLFLLCLFCGCS